MATEFKKQYEKKYLVNSAVGPKLQGEISQFVVMGLNNVKLIINRERSWT